MKKAKFITKALAFLIIISLLAGLVNEVLIPKFYYDDMFSTTLTYSGFYDMDRDSVDVIFLGTSQAACAYDPQVIYDTTGIRSYNLACEEQSMLTSYYWLKEALRYQSPKVVVLDASFVFDVGSDNPLNADATKTWKAFDRMKWSSVKWQAVRDICKYDDSQSLSDYILPNIRYHNRWKELTQKDFWFYDFEHEASLKGYVALSYAGGGINYGSIDPATENTGEEAATVPLMVDYLERIRNLCQEEGIQLILTSLPSIEGSVAKYNTLSNYAGENGLTYYDFNTQELDSAIGFDSEADFGDAGHLNIWGAQLVSSYMAGQLQGTFATDASVDGTKWTESQSLHERILNNCTMANMNIYTQWPDYVSAINKEGYTMLIAADNLDATILTEDELSLINLLGSGLSLTRNAGTNFCAAVHEGQTEESTGAGAALEGKMLGNKLDYQLSANADGASIVIDGTEYARNYDGINIVIYDDVTRQVVDNICYNGGFIRQDNPDR